MINNVYSKQQGASLVMVMLLFVALTVVGLAVMRSGILSQKQANNIHEKSVSFHVAQTSNNAVIQSTVDPNFKDEFHDNTVHLSPKTNSKAIMLAHNVSYTTCVGEKGEVIDCANNPSIDGADGVMVGETVNFYRGCSKGNNMCFGMSADGDHGCTYYEHRGTGYIDISGDHVQDSNETVTELNQWSQSIDTCEAPFEE